MDKKLVKLSVFALLIVGANIGIFLQTSKYYLFFRVFDASFLIDKGVEIDCKVAKTRVKMRFSGVLFGHVTRN